MPSTRRPNALAGPERLERIARLLAFVDAIVCPDESTQLYEFHPRCSKGARVARFRDGGGDECFLWFSKAGAVASGYSKDAGGADPDDVFAGLPRELEPARTEPAFGEDVSFALWRTPKDDRWRTGRTRKDDGSQELLARFDDHPLAYLEIARVVHEHPPDMKWVDAVWRGKTVTPEVVRGLGGEGADVEAALALAKELGIPCAKKLAFELAPAREPAKRARAKARPSGAGPRPGDHDAMFVVSVDGDVVSLSFGGKPVVSAKNADLYDHLVEYARRAIEGATARR